MNLYVGIVREMRLDVIAIESVLRFTLKWNLSKKE